MIFGSFGDDSGAVAPAPALPPLNRVPFTPPPGGNYTPRMPGAAYLTHLRPFAQVLPQMVAQRANLPGFPGIVQPGYSDANYAPLAPTPQAPGMNGFGFSGVRGRVIGPNIAREVMRTGLINPRFIQSQTSIMAAVRNAGSMVATARPAAYAGLVPAGNYAPGAL